MANIALGTLRAVNRYYTMLSANGVKPENCTLEYGQDPTSLPHVMWMLSELQNQIDLDGNGGFAVDKYSRWLGYIQGILIAKGLTTVQAERDITRGWFTDSTD